MLAIKQAIIDVIILFSKTEKHFMNSDTKLISACDICAREKWISCTKRLIFNNESKFLNILKILLLN